MARLQKSPKSSKSSKQVDALKHEAASRRNIPTAEMKSFFRRDQEAERQKFFFDRYHHLVRGVALNVDNVGIDVIAQSRIELGLEGWEVGYDPINACYCV